MSDKETKRFRVRYQEIIEHVALVEAQTAGEAREIAEDEICQGADPVAFDAIAVDFHCIEIVEETDTETWLPIFNKEGYQGKDYKKESLKDE